MPTISWYTTEMMDEFKSSATDVRARIERAAREVVLDILLQNDSRFRRLEKKTTLTFVANDDAEKLPADFRTMKRPFIEVDSAGKHIAEIDIVTDSEFWRRKGDENYVGVPYAMVETRQTPVAAEYLVLSALPAETRYFAFGYYRKPTGDDADMVENEGLVKNGIRSRFREFMGMDGAGVALQIYEGTKKNAIEHPGERATGLSLRPNKQQQRLNRRMHSYGRGN